MIEIQDRKISNKRKKHHHIFAPSNVNEQEEWQLKKSLNLPTFSQSVFKPNEIEFVIRNAAWREKQLIGNCIYEVPRDKRGKVLRKTRKKVRQSSHYRPGPFRPTLTPILEDVSNFSALVSVLKTLKHPNRGNKSMGNNKGLLKSLQNFVSKSERKDLRDALPRSTSHNAEKTINVNGVYFEWFQRQKNEEQNFLTLNRFSGNFGRDMFRAVSSRNMFLLRQAYKVITDASTVMKGGNIYQQRATNALFQSLRNSNGHDLLMASVRNGWRNGTKFFVSNGWQIKKTLLKLALKHTDLRIYQFLIQQKLNVCNSYERSIPKEMIYLPQ